MMEAIEFESKIDGGVIQLPGEYRQWTGKTVRVIVLEAKTAKTLKSSRSPHPAIAGKGKTLGDLVGPIVDQNEWETLQR